MSSPNDEEPTSSPQHPPDPGIEYIEDVVPMSNLNNQATHDSEPESASPADSTRVDDSDSDSDSDARRTFQSLQRLLDRERQAATRLREEREQRARAEHRPAQPYPMPTGNNATREDTVNSIITDLIGPILEDAQCLICREDFNGPDPCSRPAFINSARCRCTGHPLFGRNCIDRWLNEGRQNTCPVCLERIIPRPQSVNFEDLLSLHAANTGMAQTEAGLNRARPPPSPYQPYQPSYQSYQPASRHLAPAQPSGSPSGVPRLDLTRPLVRPPRLSQPRLNQYRMPQNELMEEPRRPTAHLQWILDNSTSDARYRRLIQAAIERTNREIEGHPGLVYDMIQANHPEEIRHAQDLATLRNRWQFLRDQLLRPAILTDAPTPLRPLNTQTHEFVELQFSITHLQFVQSRMQHETDRTRLESIIELQGVTGRISTYLDRLYRSALGRDDRVEIQELEELRRINLELTNELRRAAHANHHPHVPTLYPTPDEVDNNERRDGLLSRAVDLLGEPVSPGANPRQLPENLRSESTPAEDEPLDRFINRTLDRIREPVDARATTPGEDGNEVEDEVEHLDRVINRVEDCLQSLQERRRTINYSRRLSTGRRLNPELRTPAEREAFQAGLERRPQPQYPPGSFAGVRTAIYRAYYRGYVAHTDPAVRGASTHFPSRGTSADSGARGRLENHQRITLELTQSFSRMQQRLVGRSVGSSVGDASASSAPHTTSTYAMPSSRSVPRMASSNFIPQAPAAQLEPERTRSENAARNEMHNQLYENFNRLQRAELAQGGTSSSSATPRQASFSVGSMNQASEVEADRVRQDLIESTSRFPGRPRNFSDYEIDGAASVLGRRRQNQSMNIGIPPVIPEVDATTSQRELNNETYDAGYRGAPRNFGDVEATHRQRSDTASDRATTGDDEEPPEAGYLALRGIGSAVREGEMVPLLSNIPARNTAGDGDENEPANEPEEEEGAW